MRRNYPCPGIFSCNSRHYTLRAKEEGKEKCILFNLSGHGLIDMAAYDQYLAGDLLNYNLPEEEIAKNIKELEKII